MGHIDLVHIFHKLSRCFFADVLIQSTAKIVGNVVFTIGERARSAESAHNRAGFTFDAGFDLVTVNRAVTLL